MSIEAVLHTAAQSRSRAMQRAIIFTSSSRKHSAAQCVHSLAQWLQASIQSINLSCGIIKPPGGVRIDFPTHLTGTSFIGFETGSNRGRPYLAGEAETSVDFFVDDYNLTRRARL
jgi:hypothetical protein